MILYFRRADGADIEAMLADPDGWEKRFFAEPDEPDVLIDFDKAWHAVHHVLTGSDDATDHALSIVIDHTQPHCTDAQGWGGFWIVTPERMAAFAEALARLSDEDLLARYDPPAMVATNVYLADVFADETDDASDYMMQGIPALRRFADACRSTGCGAVKCLA